MRKTLLLGFVLGVFGAASPAWAEACREGPNVTVTGQVVAAFANKGGKTSLQGRAMSPCDVLMIVLDVKRPPKGCRYGATFTVTGKVDDFLGPLLTAETFKCG